MKVTRLAFFALVFAGLVHARPVIVEETVRLTPPDPSWNTFGRFGVAIDGDVALVSGTRPFEVPENHLGYAEGGVFLYRRTTTGWSYVGPLGPVGEITEWTTPAVAMKDGVAMTIIDIARLFEENGSTWTETPIESGIAHGIQGPDVEIDAGRILAGRISCNYDSMVLRKTDGIWSVEGELRGHSNGCGDNPPTPLQDLQGERAVLLNQAGSYFEPPTLRRYRRNENGIGWREELPVEAADESDFYFGPHVALNGPFTAISYTRATGTRVLYGHDGLPVPLDYGLLPANGHMQQDPWSTNALKRVGNLFAQRNWSHDDQAYVINLFRVHEDSSRPPTHVATLRARGGASLGSRFDASGNRIIVSGYDLWTGGDNVVRIFELPADFEESHVAVHDFEGASSGAAWQPAAGSHFFVKQSGTTRVYRQPSTNGFPSSALRASMSNQAIQAEITLRTYSGRDRWVGLFTRREDDANYYYVTLRTSGVVELKRMVNGVFETLSSAPTSLAIGRKVRLRLESIGTLHRVYVDDQLVCSATDDSLPAGVAGILMYRAAADYDNVILGPSTFATIYADDFSRNGPQEWQFSGGNWQRQGVMSQSSNDGYARLVAGAPADDQIVQVRVRPTGFAEPDNWVGLLLRYQDARNHVYVSLRGRGVISLWRRTDGVIQQLATRAYPVNTGVWYRLRAEVVNGVTRVFVNDTLQLTTAAYLGPGTAGSAATVGSVGLITHRASAEFDDFLAYQP